MGVIVQNMRCSLHCKEYKHEDLTPSGSESYRVGVSRRSSARLDFSKWRPVSLASPPEPSHLFFLRFPMLCQR